MSNDYIDVNDYIDTDEDDGDYDGDDGDDDGGDDEDAPSPSEGGSDWWRSLHRIREEPNQARRASMLAAHIRQHGPVSDLTKRWLGIKGY